MGYIFLIILVIYFVSGSRGGKQGFDANRRASTLSEGLIVWLGVFFIFVFGVLLWVNVPSQLQEHAVWLIIPFILSSGVFLFPLLYLPVARALSWYKFAFFLAHRSKFIFGRDPFGAAIYHAYRAIERLPDEERRRHGIQWLRNHYSNQKREVFSGAVAMVAFIEHRLKYPLEPESLAHQLTLLEGLPGRSLPGCITQYLCAYAVAPYLAKADWPKVRWIAEQWDTDASNILALSLIHVACYKHGDPSPLGLLTRFRVRVYLMRNAKLRDLLKPEPKTLVGTPARADQPNAILWGKVSERDRANYIRGQLSPSAKSRWEARAAELGVWDFSAAWSDVEVSVNRYVDRLANRQNLRDPAQYEAFERRRRFLQVLINQLEGKPQGKQGYLPVANLIDWLSIDGCLHENQDEAIRKELFYDIHGEVWNWIAFLWNQKGQKTLAYYVSARCLPLTREAGLMDMQKVLSGITSANVI